MGIAEDLQQRLSSGELIVIDGGIGTELQARGVAMDAGTWCGAANLDRGAVQAVHESYIDVGVDLITTNTFSTNRAALEWGGLGDRVEDVNRSAVEAALQARDAAATRPIAIGGSMSPFCSITVQKAALAEGRPSADTFEAGDPRRPTLAHYREQATILAEAGVDLIVLEMMNSPSDGLAAIEAATETGLPVWLGLSPSRLGDGSLGTVEEPGNHPDFEELVMLLADPRVAAVNVMHAKIAVVAESIEIVRRHFDGPVGAYAESGDWNPPNWGFTDVRPDEYLAVATGWASHGAQIIGGCCGIRPAHIEALVAGLPKVPKLETGQNFGN